MFVFRPNVCPKHPQWVRMGCAPKILVSLMVEGGMEDLCKKNFEIPLEKMDNQPFLQNLQSF